MVYRLYGLTEEEIGIVEARGDFKIKLIDQNIYYFFQDLIDFIKFKMACFIKDDLAISGKYSVWPYIAFF